MRMKLSFKVATAAMALTVLAVGPGVPAGAEAPARRSVESLHGTVTGERLPSDVACRGGRSHRQVMRLEVATGHDPASLVVTTCRMFVGAMGGVRIEGRFVLRTATGSLRGTATGTIGFTSVDDVTADLRIERRTGSLRWARGTLQLRAVVDGSEGWESVTGTLGAPPARPPSPGPTAPRVR